MSRTGRIAFCLGVALGTSAIAFDANASMGSLAPRSPGATGNAQQEWVADPTTNCRALDADYDPGDSIIWQGTCVGGLVSGQGSLSFLNNGRVLETITGRFGGGALLPGQVSASWSDGSKYEGGQSNGQFDGQGNFVSATGDKINGAWKTGALNGTATVIWRNGDRYDGEWKDGKSDGQGTEIWANGDRFEGQWKDGDPVRQTATAPSGSAAAPAPAAPAPSMTFAANRAPMGAGQSSPPPIAPAVMAQQEDQPAGLPAAMPLRDFVGKTLVAVDGSTIALDQNEGGLTRLVTLPTGVTQQTSFAFMNGRIGTVSSENAAIGLFRASGEEIDTNYIDGKTEVMKPGGAGGIVLTSRDPDGSSVCTAWYPEGHAFSQDEKKAAVEEYATRLGVDGSAPPKKHHGPRTGAQSCGGGFVTDIATTGSSPSQSVSLEPSAVQLPASTEHPEPEPGKPVGGLQAVPVKDSTVHLIDAPYEPAAQQLAIQNVNFTADAAASQTHSPASVPPPAAAQPVSNASECLSVTNNGAYWGFQNRCGTAVQFAYCEMSDANPLTSCHSTSVSGSVAANGFSALINATSLSEQGANHEFRWMACDGGAGEVVPHLDSVEPPSGRCLRAVPIDPGTNPGPAGS
jgi:hypothetical protein